MLSIYFNPNTSTRLIPRAFEPTGGISNSILRLFLSFFTNPPGLRIHIPFLPHPILRLRSGILVKHSKYQYID